MGGKKGNSKKSQIGLAIISSPLFIAIAGFLLGIGTHILMNSYDTEPNLEIYVEDSNINAPLHAQNKYNININFKQLYKRYNGKVFLDAKLIDNNSEKNLPESLNVRFMPEVITFNDSTQEANSTIYITSNEPRDYILRLMATREDYKQTAMYRLKSTTKTPELEEIQIINQNGDRRFNI